MSIMIPALRSKSIEQNGQMNSFHEVIKIKECLTNKVKDTNVFEMRKNF